MNEITIGDKIYISSKKAAEITGYAKDYVGQLCREGHLDAKMVGRSWYVYEPSIREHRFGPAEEEYQIPASPIENEAAEAAESSESVEEPISAADSWVRPTYTAETPDFIPEVVVGASSNPAPTAYTGQNHSVPESSPVSSDPASTLSDMQDAWKEWFERRQLPEIETPQIIEERIEAYQEEREEHEEEEGNEHTEEVNDEIEEDYTDEEVQIPVHKIVEDSYDDFIPERIQPLEASGAAPIAIHKVETPYVSSGSSTQAPMQQSAQRTEAQIPVRMSISRATANREVEPEGRIIHERVVRRESNTSSRHVGKKRSNVIVIAILIVVSIFSILAAAVGSGFFDTYIKALAGNNSIINFLVGTSIYINK